MHASSNPTAILPPIAAAVPTGVARVREWLTFRLGSEEYGIDILQVQEIRSYEKPTRLVSAPHAVKGVINLRGVLVPVVDMRIQFGLEAVAYDEFTVVIVLIVGDQTIGMVIDSVSDVIMIEPAEIRPAPAFEGRGISANLLGIGSLGERTLLLMDVVAVVSSPELALVKAPEAQVLAWQ